MTHLLDSSAVLADFFGEPGTDRVAQLIDDPRYAVGISVLSLYETYTAVSAPKRLQWRRRGRPLSSYGRRWTRSSL